MARKSHARFGSFGVVLVLVAGVLLTCGPLLLHDPLPRGSDVYAACHYLQSFTKAFAEGDLLPRWTDRSNQGLGAPMFVFYPPLTYYGAGIALWLAGSMVGALKLYLVLLTALTGASFYALAREWIGPGLPSAIAAALYLMLPYRVLDIYQRFALAETTAFLFMPLVVLFARRALTRRGSLDAALLAVSYAGLIATHVITAFIFSLLFALWVIWEARGRWAALLHLVLSCLCGLALAAPVLLPAVAERTHVNIAWAREMPNGDFRINFIFKDDLLPGLNIKDPVKPPVLKSAHSQLALAALAALLALRWSSRAERRRRSDVLALGTGCALAYLLQLELSTPVWRLVPELPTIQFPWRFQTLMVLTTALLCGFALSAGFGGSKRAARFLGLGLLSLSTMLLANVALAGQNAFLKPFDFDEARTQQPSVVQWIQPALTPVEHRAYRQFNRTRVELPRVAFVEGAGRTEVQTWESSRRLLRVESPTGGTVQLGAFWFPGWTATLDGDALDLDATAGGLIRFRVPPGPHEVTLRFGPTTARRTAAWIGVVGILALPLLVWLVRRSRTDRLD